MTTKKSHEHDNPEQSEKFVQKASELVGASELNPTEASEEFDLAMKKILPPRKRSRLNSYNLNCSKDEQSGH